MTRKPRSGYEIAKARTTKALRELVATSGKAEYRLHCAIVELLRTAHLPGVVFFHVENERKRDHKQQAAFKAMGGLAGVSDLVLAIPGGRICFMEVKAATDLSEAQEAFLAGMEAHGHRTAVVRSLDEAAFILAAWGAIRGATVAA